MVVFRVQGKVRMSELPYWVELKYATKKEEWCNPYLWEQWMKKHHPLQLHRVLMVVTRQSSEKKNEQKADENANGGDSRVE